MSETTREPSVIARIRLGLFGKVTPHEVLEAYDAIVAERDAAVREMAKARSIASKYAGDADLLYLILEEQKENGRGGLLPKVHARARKAERENDTLRARLAAATELEAEVSAANRRLKARLAACELVAKAAVEWYTGKASDGVLCIAVKDYRAAVAAVAAETQGEKDA